MQEILFMKYCNIHYKTEISPICSQSSYTIIKHELWIVKKFITSNHGDKGEAWWAALMYKKSEKKGRLHTLKEIKMKETTP